MNKSKIKEKLQELKDIVEKGEIENINDIAAYLKTYNIPI